MNPVIEEKIEIAPELLEQLQTQVEKQVIVHCTVTGIPNYNTVRVWPTIYLIPKEFDRKSKLLHHFNIALYPNSQRIGATGKHHFTLIFEGLPSGCKYFDIVEIIPEKGAFEAMHIARNESDTYQVVFE
jgi:hypothetical protein